MGPQLSPAPKLSVSAAYGYTEEVWNAHGDLGSLTETPDSEQVKDLYFLLFVFDSVVSFYIEVCSVLD